MFRIKKTFEISGNHHLNLPYESKCSNSHGHNWLITICCAASDEKVKKNNYMVVDFTTIEKLVMDALDHKDLNDVEGLSFIKYEDSVDPMGFSVNPTAERIAKWICEQIDECYRVDVRESTGNVASYEDDDFFTKLNLREEM